LTDVVKKDSEIGDAVLSLKPSVQCQRMGTAGPACPCAGKLSVVIVAVMVTGWPTTPGLGDAVTEVLVGVCAKASPAVPARPSKAVANIQARRAARSLVMCAFYATVCIPEQIRQSAAYPW
jgi:hypothetical protein